MWQKNHISDLLSFCAIRDVQNADTLNNAQNMVWQQTQWGLHNKSLHDCQNVTMKSALQSINLINRLKAKSSAQHIHL